MMQLQLKMYSKQAKMSQAELAAMLGVSARMVAQRTLWLGLSR